MRWSAALPPLLENYCLRKLSIELTGDAGGDASPQSLILEALHAIDRNDTSRFLIDLTLESNCEESKGSGWRLAATIRGIFSLPTPADGVAADTPASLDQLIHAAAVLVGTLRGVLLQATGGFGRPPFQLPAVNVHELLQMSQTATSKSRAPKKKEPTVRSSASKDEGLRSAQKPKKPRRA